MEIKCTEEQKKNIILVAETHYLCPFNFEDANGKDCKANANCRWCLNNRIVWHIE